MNIRLGELARRTGYELVLASVSTAGRPELRHHGRATSRRYNFELNETRSAHAAARVAHAHDARAGFLYEEKPAILLTYTATYTAAEAKLNCLRIAHVLRVSFNPRAAISATSLSFAEAIDEFVANTLAPFA